MSDKQQLVVVTGAESSGKSTLAAALAAHFNAPLVPEVARTYFAARSTTTYGPDDLRAIAREQARVEQITCTTGTPALVLADTDQRVIDLWWQEKYPTLASNFALPAAVVSPQRCYLLCYPDLPWEADPLRENPHDRLRLFTAQLQALVAERQRFRVIWGLGAGRRERAVHWVKQQLQD